MKTPYVPALPGHCLPDISPAFLSRELFSGILFAQPYHHLFCTLSKDFRVDADTPKRSTEPKSEMGLPKRVAAGVDGFLDHNKLVTGL